MFHKNKTQQTDASVDRMAKVIAEKIVLRQRQLAEKLNKAVNRHSKNRQKLFLWLFCGVTAACLILCLLHPFGEKMMGMPAHNYQPSYIGSPSELPIKAGHHTTDSLTTKK